MTKQEQLDLIERQMVSRTYVFMMESDPEIAKNDLKEIKELAKRKVQLLKELKEIAE